MDKVWEHYTRSQLDLVSQETTDAIIMMLKLSKKMEEEFKQLPDLGNQTGEREANSGRQGHITWPTKAGKAM